MNFTAGAFYLLLLLTLISSNQTSHGPIFQGFVSTKDKLQLKKLFFDNSEQALNNAGKFYNIMLGLYSLDEKLPGILRSCPSVIHPSQSPEMALYSAFASKLFDLKNCMITSDEIKKMAEVNLVPGISAENLYNLVTSMKLVNASIDSKRIVQLVSTIKNKDTSPTTMAFLLQTLVHLGLSKSALKDYISDIDDILTQADEISDSMLFYEKGIYTTAIVAKAIVNMIDALGEIPKGTEYKLVKLFNFLYNRRQITNLRTAAHLAYSFKTLSMSSLLLPVYIAKSVESNGILESSGPIFEVYREKPILELRLINVWTGAPLTFEEISLKAKGLYSIKNSDLILSGPIDLGNFRKGSKDSLFELPFGQDASLVPYHGYYKLSVSGEKKQTNDNRKFLGISDTQIRVNVLTEVKITHPTITVMDTVHERHIADISLTPGEFYKSSSSNGVISLEHNHQISLEFHLEYLDSQISFPAHQVFVQLTHAKTLQTITFTCEELQKDKTTTMKTYRFHLNPDTSAADFDHLSGVYKVKLFVGDPLIKNPINWQMYDLQLNFIGEPGSESKRREAQANDVSRQRSYSSAGSKLASRASSIVGQGPTKMKPEINHIFRVPEKRAPLGLALAFSVLCVLPLLGLLISWVGLGINISNFKISLPSLIFHSGLIAILCLYFIYWLRLDMFTTLGYLAILGVPTFLAGNCLLRAQVLAKENAGQSVIQPSSISKK